MLDYDIDVKTDTVTGARVVINDDIVFDDSNISKFTITESVCDDSKMSVGNVISNSLSLDLINVLPEPDENGDVVYNDDIYNKDKTGQKIEVFVSYGTSEIPLGTFLVTDCVQNGMITSITALDRFSSITYEDEYESGLDWSSTHTLAEIAKDINKSLNTDLFIPELYIKKEPVGYTKRQMLSYIAAAYGLNVRMYRHSETYMTPYFVKFGGTDNVVNATIDGEITFQNGLTVNNINSYVSGVFASTSDGDLETYRNDSDTDVTEVQIEADMSPFDYTASDNLANAILGLKYRAFDWNGIGNPLIEPGDKIGITTDDGEYYESYVFTNTLTYNGALTQTLTASTDSSTKSAMVGSVSNKVTSTVVNTITNDENTSNQIAQTVINQITNVDNSTNGNNNTYLTQLTENIVNQITNDNSSTNNTYITQLKNALDIISVKSVTALPSDVDENTIYLIQGEVDVN
jgi:hypothetical protein